MRILLWIVFAVAAVLAILLGLLVQQWIADDYPLNIIFFGHRLASFVALSLALCLALIAVTFSCEPFRREARQPWIAASASHGTKAGFAPVDPGGAATPVRTERATASSSASRSADQRAAA